MTNEEKDKIKNSFTEDCVETLYDVKCWCEETLKKWCSDTTIMGTETIQFCRGFIDEYNALIGGE
jgi:protoheme ferro-lyase